LTKSVDTRQRVSLIALLLVVFASTITACTPFTVHQQECSCAPPPYPFAAQLDQMAATGTAGAFAFKAIDITPQQFRFYYVFESSQQSPHPLSLSVTASAELPTKSATKDTLATTIQVLGQIGAYTVGVVHVGRGQNVAQTIILKVQPKTAAGADVGAPWRLTPMQQLMPEPHANTARGGLATTLNGAPGALPEAQWFGEVMPQLVGYVKVIIPGQPVANRSYVFLRSDDPIVVTVITKAQYLAIAGAANFTP